MTTTSAGPGAGHGPLAAVFLDGVYEDADYYVAAAHAADVVAAADGAAAFLVAHDVRVDLLVGDFDSLPEAAVAALAEGGSEISRHPVRKDRTDGELAVQAVLERGAGRLLLAGALGSLDHTLGHLTLLHRAEVAGAPARLVSPGLCVRVLVGPSSCPLRSDPGTRVSLVSLGGDAVVTLVGLVYGLDRQVLPWSACLGLGNAVLQSPAEVTVHHGVVAVLVVSGHETFA